jgi:hypothetical protein
MDGGEAPRYRLGEKGEIGVSMANIPWGKHSVGQTFRRANIPWILVSDTSSPEYAATASVTRVYPYSRSWQ